MKLLIGKYIKFWIEDEIVIGEPLKAQTYDLNIVREAIELRHEISDNKDQYVCFDIRKITNYEKEAIDYVQKHGKDFILAYAIVVDSSFTKFFMNVTSVLQNSPLKFKAFRKKEDAIEWLKSLKNS